MATHSPDITGVIVALEQVLQALQTAIRSNNNIDEKLADYVFFPLSHVLKESNKLPARAVELCLQILLDLLKTGWRHGMPPALFCQLFILVTFMASSSEAKDKNTKTSEDLQEIAFFCLRELWRIASVNAECRKILLSSPNVPTLGHSISVTVDSCLESSSNGLQLAAVESLQASIAAMKERDVVATFLPGIMSAMTKLLTPSSRRRPFRALEVALRVVTLLLKTVLNDILFRNDNMRTPNVSSSARKEDLFDASWLKATSGQVKQALANIIKIRKHERIEVRRALLDLATTVLRDCENTLADAASMMLETVVVLSASGLQEESELALKTLIQVNNKFLEYLQSRLYNWVISLPRIMLSQDDDAKQHLVQQISVTYRLLNDEKVELSVVDRIMAGNLRDSVQNSIKVNSKVIEQSDTSGVALEVTNTFHFLNQSSSFDPIIMTGKNQTKTVAELHLLLKQLSMGEASPLLLGDLVEGSKIHGGDAQVASFWLARQLLDLSSQTASQFSEFLDFGLDQSSSIVTELSEELYSLSLDIISNVNVENSVDWRLQALSLETIASQAKLLTTDFRDELIDVLYPLLHLMGSSNSDLRHHSIVCLNIVAESCGYASTGEMVVENADYLTNAVAIKLNTFDISPQAPLVLNMMIRLVGPKLLPFLDDLVSSIFASLEYYHGYPKLVELLFSVLKTMAEEGAKSSQLQITTGDETAKQDKEALKYKSVAEVVDIILKLNLSLAKDKEEIDVDRFPERPWKDPSENPDEGSTEDEQLSAPSEEPPPPAPKTYNLLLRIAQLTQYYLTSASPTLRTSLLSLLGTVLPPLSLHENSFLPLINTIWPVLVPRLDDPEAYIKASSLDVMSLMCKYGGDFMRSRLDDIWSLLFRLNPWTETSTKKKAVHTNSGILNLSRNKSQHGMENSMVRSTGTGVQWDLQQSYVDSPSKMIWESLLKLFMTIIRHVNIDEEKYEDVLDLMQPMLLKRGDIREVMESRNPDAVWLRMQRLIIRGSSVDTVGTSERKQPNMPSTLEGSGLRFAEFDLY